jgi:hypothetical protein
MAIRSEPFSGCNTKQGAPSNAPSKLWNAALALAAFSLVAAAPSPSQSGQPSDLSAPELEAAKKLGLPIAQTGAPLCKTPEVLIGAKKLTAGIAALNKAIDEIQNNAFLFQSTRPDDTGQPKGAGTTLTPEERQQIDVLEGLRAKLRKKIEELEGAPSCESLLAAHALPASGGATLGLHLIETPQGGAPLRGGAAVSYPLQPFGDGVAVAPFVSFDDLERSVNGALRATLDYEGTAGVKIGPRIAPGAWIYAIAGASIASETVSTGFVKQRSAAWGGTAGAGISFMPAPLQGLALPVSLFADYQHTWRQERENASPGAACAPFREDDAVKIGFSIAFGMDLPPDALAAGRMPGDLAHGSTGSP